MKQSITIILSLFLFNTLLSQSTNVEAYSWENSSELSPSADKTTAIIGLKTEFIDEFAIGSGGDLSLFTLRRKMVQVGKRHKGGSI